MPHPSWYLRRLRAMSPAEIGWRVQGTITDHVDRVRARRPASLADPAVAAHAPSWSRPQPPRLCDLPPGAWARAAAGTAECNWCGRLTASAERLLGGRLDVFGRALDVGPRIDWNREHVHGTSVPLLWASRIDYRDLAVAGDAKIVWEPNRHHHLVVLARAYRATGNRRYASAAIEQLSSWLEQCPPGRGINWRSPLELAIRLVNWTWTFDLLRDSGQLTPTFCERFLASVHFHLRDITRKFSRGSSANNHLIGEAAGTFVASSYFTCLSSATDWQRQSYDILCREVLAQTYPDGGGREQATGYQLFVFQLLLAAGIAGRRTGRDFPPAYWGRLEQMLDFVQILSAGGALPAFGDADMGYVLDVGQADDQFEAALNLGAVLFDRPDFRRGRTTPYEPVRWLLGCDGSTEALPACADAPSSHALRDSGYYILRARLGDSTHEVAAVVDCGPLGFTALAAHGHADALSLVVHAFGRELLVDPGTFDYFTYPAWREYFRSTRAHNTVTVDQQDQSVQLGLFLWGQRANARCVEWTPADCGGVVVGEHDGYRRLADPVMHRRAVRLDGARQLLLVRDELSMAGDHEIAVRFHFAEEHLPQQTAANQWDIAVGAHLVRFTGDPRLRWSAASGAERPIDGWVSRNYHVKQPAVTLTGGLATRGPTAVECTFEFLP